MHYVFGVISYL